MQRDEQGQPLLILETNTDTTERKRNREALRQAEADLTRMHRVLVLGEMTSSIAHEINQPVSASITNASAGLRWLAARPPNVDGRLSAAPNEPHGAVFRFTLPIDGLGSSSGARLAGPDAT